MGLYLSHTIIGRSRSPAPAGRCTAAVQTDDARLNIRDLCVYNIIIIIIIIMIIIVINSTYTHNNNNISQQRARVYGFGFQ